VGKRGYGAGCLNNPAQHTTHNNKEEYKKRIRKKEEEENTFSERGT